MSKDQGNPFLSGNKDISENALLSVMYGGISFEDKPSAPTAPTALPPSQGASSPVRVSKTEDPTFAKLKESIYRGVPKANFLKELTKSKGFKINFVDQDGKSLAHYAIEAGQVNILQVLIDNGSVNSKKDFSSTLIQYAINYGQVNCLDFLKRKNFHVSEGSKEPSSDFLFSILKANDGEKEVPEDKKIEMLKTCLDSYGTRKSKLYGSSLEGLSMFQYACKNGNMSVATHIFKELGRIDDLGEIIGDICTYAQKNQDKTTQCFDLITQISEKSNEANKAKITQVLLGALNNALESIDWVDKIEQARDLGLELAGDDKDQNDKMKFYLKKLDDQLFKLDPDRKTMNKCEYLEMNCGIEKLSKYVQVFNVKTFLQQEDNILEIKIGDDHTLTLMSVDGNFEVIKSLFKGTYVVKNEPIEFAKRLQEIADKTSNPNFTEDLKGLLNKELMKHFDKLNNDYFQQEFKYSDQRRYTLPMLVVKTGNQALVEYFIGRGLYKDDVLKTISSSLKSMVIPCNSKQLELIINNEKKGYDCLVDDKLSNGIKDEDMELLTDLLAKNYGSEKKFAEFFCEPSSGEFIKELIMLKCIEYGNADRLKIIFDSGYKYPDFIKVGLCFYKKCLINHEEIAKILSSPGCSEELGSSEAMIRNLKIFEETMDCFPFGHLLMFAISLKNIDYLKLMNDHCPELFKEFTKTEENLMKIYQQIPQDIANGNEDYDYRSRELLNFLYGDLKIPLPHEVTTGKAIILNKRSKEEVVKLLSKKEVDKFREIIANKSPDELLELKKLFADFIKLTSSTISNLTNKEYEQIIQSFQKDKMPKIFDIVGRNAMKYFENQLIARKEIEEGYILVDSAKSFLRVIDKQIDGNQQRLPSSSPVALGARPDGAHHGGRSTD